MVGAGVQMETGLAVSLEMSEEESMLRDEINRAIEERNHKDAARLWGTLCDEVPHHEDDHVRFMDALWRIHDWERAEQVASVARRRFPSSVRIDNAYAFTAFLQCNWAEAVRRFEDLRKNFDPTQHLESHLSIYWQLVAYGEMFDYTSARIFTDKQWPFLKSRPAVFHSALLLMHIWIEPLHVDAFREWASSAMPPAQSVAFKKRLLRAKKNGEYMRHRKGQVKLVSLGQSCLPFVTPLRWGLHPDVFDISEALPFDLLGSIGNTSSIEILSGFTNLLDQNLLVETKMNNTPMLTNKKLSSVFFHEKGPWWREDNWTRFQNSYKNRVDNFLSLLKRDGCLYIFCLSGGGDGDALINAYLSKLDAPHTRLLFINVLSEPFQASFSHPRVKIMNHPYPEDYSWNEPGSYDSEEGHIYETRIIDEIFAGVDILLGASDPANADRISW